MNKMILLATVVLAGGNGHKIEAPAGATVETMKEIMVAATEGIKVEEVVVVVVANKEVEVLSKELFSKATIVVEPAVVAETEKEVEELEEAVKEAVDVVSDDDKVKFVNLNSEEAYDLLIESVDRKIALAREFFGETAVGMFVDRKDRLVEASKKALGKFKASKVYEFIKKVIDVAVGASRLVLDTTVVALGFLARVFVPGNTFKNEIKASAACIRDSYKVNVGIHFEDKAKMEEVSSELKGSIEEVAKELATA